MKYLYIYLISDRDPLVGIALNSFICLFILHKEKHEVYLEVLKYVTSL